MSLQFKPNGTLNVSAAGTDLSQAGIGTNAASGDMTRCKNLSLDRVGRADTRPGSTKLNSNALALAANFIIEQAGNRYAFAGTRIYRDELEIAAGRTAADWSAIRYNQFNDTDQQVFALNGTDRVRINGTDVHEWGIDAPTTAPTLGVGASTGLTGDYNVKYTYIRKLVNTVISESNPSPAATSTQTLANESLDVTFTASTDPQVTHVRVYRTTAGGGTYFVDQDIEVGTTTVDTTTADVDLGAEAATNHDRPPATGTIVVGPTYDGLAFIADGNKLHWCLARQPEYWPTTNFVEVGTKQFPITAIAILTGQIYVFTAQRPWLIQGTAAGAFNPVSLQGEGAPSLHNAVAIEGRGVFHVGGDGIYQLIGGRDQKLTEATLEPLFRAEDVNGMQAYTELNAWLAHYENRLYAHWGNGNAAVFNLDTGRLTYYKWDRALLAPAIDKTNDRFLACDAAGFVRVLEDRDASDDAGTGIDWEVESKEFTAQTRSHFPRWAKYDTTGTMTGSILLDGEVHQEHSLSASRDTTRRLIAGGNGRRCSIRLSGTGASTVYAVEME